jgi:hypothetical protein
MRELLHVSTLLILRCMSKHRVLVVCDILLYFGSWYVDALTDSRVNVSSSPTDWSQFLDIHS